MANEEPAAGYKRPPKATQFKPGQSGNPTGRKKGVPNLKTELIAELNETVTFEEDGHKGRLTRQRAIVKRLVGLAIEGDIRAINAIVALCQSLDLSGGQRANDAARGDVDADGEGIMHDFLQRERRRSDHAADRAEKGTQ